MGYHASPRCHRLSNKRPVLGMASCLEVVGQGRECPIDHHSKYRLLPLFLLTHQNLKGRPISEDNIYLNCTRKKIKLVPSWKLPPYQLSFVELLGASGCLGEKTSAESYVNNQSSKMCSLLLSGHEHCENNQLLYVWV